MGGIVDNLKLAVDLAATWPSYFVVWVLSELILRVHITERVFYRPMKSLATLGTDRETPGPIVIPSDPPGGDVNADPTACSPDGPIMNGEGSKESYVAAAEPLVEIESVVRGKPFHPSAAGSIGVLISDGAHADCVMAICSRATAVVVAPRSPAVHKALRIGPGALVEANLVHICGQPLGLPARYYQLNLHYQKCDEQKGQKQSASKEDNAYSPLSKGHI